MIAKDNVAMMLQLKYADRQVKYG